MATPLFETLSGMIDGVNDVFTFSEAYASGTVAIYLNGQLLLNDAGNPWAESDPSTGEVTIATECIPRVGDEIAGFAIPADAGDEDICFVDEMAGVLDDVETLDGVMKDEDQLAGVLEDQGIIVGTLADADRMSGVLSDDVDELVGVLEDC